ncbi:DMT family transporter [Candidatus Bealeia paramacronuclearis]|uniref:DMT family transporter n=1 Tax=Candidatus Bealeia paramacronuclearis TaxID=1921001 RepID=UPI002F26DD79
MFVFSLLFAGSSWIFVRIQVQYVPADLAVFYRFLISGLGLLLFSKFKGEKFQKFPVANLPWLAAFGITFYYLNTWCCYKAVDYLPSGIVAMGLSLLMIPSSLLDSFWNKKPVQKTILVSGCLSLIGLLFALDNNNTFSKIEISTREMVGFSFILMCLSFASVGSLLSVHLKKLPLTVIQGTAYGLLTGAFFNGLVYFLSGRSFLWFWEPEFLISLFYLSFFLSGFVFVSYNLFLQAWGVGKANYFFVLAPVIAMNVSALFEGMEWTLPRIFGTTLVISSGLIILKATAIKQFFKRVS